jgi:hypothetical protein
MPELAYAELPGPGQVDPSRLTILLEEVGWHLIGGRREAYNRLAPPSDPSGRQTSLVVPLDRTAPEFEEMMAEVLRKVARPEYQEDWQRRILPRLLTRRSDEYRFRKETDLAPGLISWREGESLIQAARSTMVAAAKASVTKARHFGNKNGQFANRYLASVLMGQTEPGSYVVTAYAPSEEDIPLKPASANSPSIPGVDSLRGRDVAKCLTGALGAAREAIDYFRQHNSSLDGFDAGVESGFSYELANALVSLTEDAEQSDVFVEWHPSDEHPRTLSESFSFTSADTPVLGKAAARLVSTQPKPRTPITGRVHLLNKKDAGLPGVIGIEVLDGSKPRKVRAHLMESSDYHLAVRAHEEDLVLRVVGDLEREGNLHWLYRAHVEQLLGPVPESTRSESRGIPGEQPFDFDFGTG